ncbi:MAG TPA: serine hydrolase [Planctomycetota bacterium]|nr:serine hydrolase [Planctomycetota bacterium]
MKSISTIRASLRRALFVAAVSLCAAPPAPSADVPAPPELEAVRASIERRIADGTAPSLAVAVVKDDRIIWAEGFGLADVEANRKATSDSIYLLASVSKPITATGLMVLVDCGLIDLDRPANDYLPGAKLRAHEGAADEITVRRLANHTGGLPIHYNFYYAGTRPLSWDEAIRRYGFAATAPGSRWEYSNLAFGLLGYMTEVVSKVPWREFLEREVFDLLGMTRTSDRVRPGLEGEATAQYGPDAAGRFVRVEPYDFDHPGASAFWASANDLARFARMHINGGALDGSRVLTEASAALMRRMAAERQPGAGTGIGWAVGSRRGRATVSHTGGMPGVATALELYPDDRAAIVVLSNSHGHGLVGRTTERIARVLFPEDLTERRGVVPRVQRALNSLSDSSPESSDGFTGTWRGRLEHFDGDIPLELRVEDSGAVAISFSGRRRGELEGVRIRGTRFEGRTSAPLRTQAGFHGVPNLELRLERSGERLTGVCVALAQGYFALSHWVALERDAAPAAAASAPAPAEKPRVESVPASGSVLPVRYDVLIRGGRVVDGTGAPWSRVDVAVRDGRIAAMGTLPDAEAERTIDAAGLVVAPGFIDMMGQTAAPFLKSRDAALNLLTQGITTINAGEGVSDAPLGEEAGKKAGWRTMREFFERLEAAGLPLNVAQTVGHTQVRSIVIGDRDRKAEPGELERMKALVQEAMEAGAIGLSTSLIYPPAVYAPEEEILELARVAGERGGRYFTHMRNEGDQLLEAIDEALRIGRGAGTPVHIFHLKTAGKGNWGKMDLALARIRAARAAGQEVGADVYPYVQNGLGIRAFLHPRHAAEGLDGLLRRLEDPAVRAEMRREMEIGSGWENWFAHTGHDWDRVVLGRIQHPEYARHGGKTVLAIARAEGQDPWDVFFAMARAGAFAMPETMCEANKIKAMKEEFMSFDTDVGPAHGSATASHPRGYGSFPRVLSRYVRELGVLSLEAAIQRMTAVASNEILARDRGRLAPGLAADIVIFDEGTIRDAATFAEPALPSVGVRHVLVNGTLVLDDGKFTGAAPGKVLRGPGFRE